MRVPADDDNNFLRSASANFPACLLSGRGGLVVGFWECECEEFDILSSCPTACMLSGCWTVGVSCKCERECEEFDIPSSCPTACVLSGCWTVVGVSCKCECETEELDIPSPCPIAVDNPCYLLTKELALIKAPGPAQKKKKKRQ